MNHPHCPVCGGTSWRKSTDYKRGAITEVFRNLMSGAFMSFLVALVLFKVTESQWPFWAAVGTTILFAAVSTSKHYFRQCAQCSYRFQTHADP